MADLLELVETMFLLAAMYLCFGLLELIDPGWAERWKAAEAAASMLREEKD